MSDTSTSPYERAPQQVTRLILAEDQAIVRSGFALLLSGLREVEVTAEALNGEHLLELVDRLQPDLVLTDLAMPALDGIAATARLAETHPELPVLVVSMNTDPIAVRRALAAGARGYLFKDASLGDFANAIESVRRTGSYHNPHVEHILAQHDPVPLADVALSPRQVQVLTMLASGLATKEIGFQLGLSSKTVDVHRARIMHSLGLHDIASLTRYALRMGLIAV